jgi:putative cardiolipin synthase
VRIRLLLDDLGVGAANDDAFLLLEAYPQVSVRLFTPIAWRGARTAGMIADPLRVNHRMHNKSMTADNLLTVVGGRNIGDEYFSLDELVNFADMDVLAIGPVVNQVSDSFDIFWNSPASIPISAFHEESPSAEQLARGRVELDTFVAEHGGAYYEAMRTTPFNIDVRSREVELYWGVITALFDLPEKALGQETDLLIHQLGNLLGSMQKDVLIISPYFVPGKKGTAALVTAAESGVRVRVFTNSLAATDVGAVHAGYKKSRRKLLEGGVEIFELMPHSNANQETQSKLAFSGSSGASLHAKMYIFDRQQVFIGSMNLDPRSVAINTEIGLLIDSADLATDLQANIEKGHTASFYTLALEPRNKDKRGGSKRLVWIEQKNGKETRYTKEPHTTSWQRFKVGFIGLFPIDSQL